VKCAEKPVKPFESFTFENSNLAYQPIPARGQSDNWCQNINTLSPERKLRINLAEGVGQKPIRGFPMILKLS